jgi:hypothetical protein
MAEVAWPSEHPIRDANRASPYRDPPMAVEFEELELPFDEPVDVLAACVVTRDPLATFPWCPLCDGELTPEHAHFRCTCGWRDSCCD